MILDNFRYRNPSQTKNYRNNRRRTTVYFVDEPRTTFHFLLFFPVDFNGAGSPLRTYVWRDDIPVAIIDHPGDTVLYLETDHLNTPIAARNQAGTVVWKWESDAFGATLPNGDPDGDGMPTTINLRFPGQYYDKESGLHYNFRRYYDPTLGRYVSSDPIGLAGGINTYGYVEGNPLSRIDPEGLQAVPMPPPPIPGFPISGGSQGKGNDGSMGGLFPPGTFSGNTSSNGGPMSTPDPIEARASDKERATDTPSWSKGYAQKPGESCDQFASRILSQHYGCDDPRAQKRGPNSEHSKIKKHCERGGR